MSKTIIQIGAETSLAGKISKKMLNEGYLLRAILDTPYPSEYIHQAVFKLYNTV